MCNGVAHAGVLAVTLQLLLGLPEHAAEAEGRPLGHKTQDPVHEDPVVH